MKTWTPGNDVGSRINLFWLSESVCQEVIDQASKPPILNLKKGDSINTISLLCTEGKSDLWKPCMYNN